MHSTPRSQRGLLGAAVVFAVVTLIFGAVALSRPAPPKPVRDAAQIAFEASGLLVLQSPQDLPAHWTFTVARAGAVMFAFLGTLGVLLELYRPASDGWIRLTSWFARVVLKKRPAIVIGLGRVGGPIAKALRLQGRPVYAIALDDSTAPAAEARALGTLVLTGDAREDRLRHRLPLDGSPEIFIATGNDARNNEIAGELLVDAAERGGRGLRCFIHSSDPMLAATLESHRLLFDPQGRIGFAVFNLQEETARAVLLNETDGILRVYPPDAVAHYILIGFGAMGQTLALQMGRLAHFDTLQRLRLTVMDHFAGAMTHFLERHPGFCPDPAQFDLLKHRDLTAPEKDGWACRAWRPADISRRSDRPDAIEYAVNAEFVDVPPAPAVPRAMLDALFDRLGAAPSATEPAVTQVVVIASDDEQRNFETALGLRAELEVARLEGRLAHVIPMYVYLPTERGLAQILQSSPDFQESASVRVHTFGARTVAEAYEQAAMPDIREMAKVVHHRYAKGYGSPLTFDELPPMLQASNIDAAAHLDVKLDVIGYRRRRAAASEAAPPLKLTNEQLDILSRMEHNRWLAERLITGWRYGEKRTLQVGSTVHDNYRRLSFVPWEHLSGTQRGEKWKDIEQVAALDVICGEAKQVVEPKPGPRRRDRTPASTA
jgi:hypothetical protein